MDATRTTTATRTATAIRTTTALLVDDEPDSCRANQGRLEGQGYLVIVARNETEAVSRAKQSSPKIIFVHLVAGQGSLHLMQALRSDDGCRHIPVILMTDHRDARVDKAKLRTMRREG